MTKLRIAVVNNYDLIKVEKEVENHEVPNHLLFGLNYLRDYGHSIETFSVNNTLNPKTENGIYNRLYRFITHFENIGLQKEIFKRRHEFDLIYCLCGGVSEWLYMKSASDNLHIPILTLYHHPLPSGKLDPFRNLFRKKIFKNQKGLLCLSKKTAQSFGSLMKNRIAKSISWGVDQKFYEKITQHIDNSLEQNIVLTCGRTARDLKTFAKAIKKAGIRGHIICPSSDKVSDGRSDNFLSYETTSYNMGKKENTYLSMANIMGRVKVMAIPLEKQSTLAGLTSLMDCLGFGKPVIMTRNACIDIDIEAEGIGKWVDPYDVSGWVKAIDWHYQNEEKSKEMARKAKVLGKQMSSETFGTKINNLILKSCKNWKYR